MRDLRVIVVMLRQPRGDKPQEKRTDPLWEFGSFGCTGCHQRNLMNPRKVNELDGSQLAFAQGGDAEIRLVHVTPPVRMRVHRGRFAEATWQPSDMPLAYESAPVLVDNRGYSDCPVLIELIDDVRRSTPVARFVSKFRSRRKPLPPDIGRQLVAAYRGFRRGGATVARDYTDALPYPPPMVDPHRKRTYDKLLRMSSRSCS